MHSLLLFQRTLLKVAFAGVEPTPAEPKSAVLPLYEKAREAQGTRPFVIPY